jgi:molecular chaperone HtpG
MQKGNISVQTENIFPIIKKFLYSDQEIFLRELISNATDATTKLKTLAQRGEVKGEIGNTTIDIILDAEAKTLTIRDRGIGMTKEEVEKYLNQVAFSSAQEFIEKYQTDSIIGHFGLGFYSAFMVAAKVDVVSLSYKEGATPVLWTCEGNPEYMIGDAEKTERGTDIILHISDDSLEYLENNKIQDLLDKYCKFLPVEICFGTKTETAWEGEGENETSTETQVPNIINNPHPLWKKSPSDLTDADYQDFYKELYPMSGNPLFWIHLNIDYPFNLTGILYFPKLNNNLEVQKNKIQLYCNQVFVTDDVKQIMPEFLTLLHGVVDSPDIPLNVSRSYLQSDREVKKITSYITKKVSDKLVDLYKKDRPSFEAKWPDIGTFVKYGMLTDDKFSEKAMDFVLFKTTDDKYHTLAEYKELIKGAQTDKYDRTVVLYTNSPSTQDSFIRAAKNKGYYILDCDTLIDNHFMQHIEHKENIFSFVRVDSDTVDNLVQKDEKQESILSEKEQEKVKTTFETISKPTAGASIQLKALSPDDQPVQITRNEFMRRMKEMQQMQGMGMDGFPDNFNVVVNTNHPLVSKVLHAHNDHKEQMAKYLFDLALLNQGMLKGADLTAFIESSLANMK